MKINGTEVPRYMRHAEDELGVEEWGLAGMHNTRILEYHETTTLGDWGRSRDETPWCSSYVNWCVSQAGLEGTSNALARSWIRWGVPATGASRYGDVVVLRRRKSGADKRTGSRGGYHVAFLARMSSRYIRLLGGNQSDKVQFSTYSLKRYELVALRRAA